MALNSVRRKYIVDRVLRAGPIACTMAKSDSKVQLKVSNVMPFFPVGDSNKHNLLVAEELVL